MVRDMLLIKRLACGFIAVLVILLGLKLIDKNIYAFQILGVCSFVIGISLAYISILRRAPKYNFWVTIVAFVLAFALYMQLNQTNKSDTSNESVVAVSSNKTDDNNSVEKKETSNIVSNLKAKRKYKQKLSGYPKISGTIDVIHAHIFKIHGRYVKLFGVDAPDNDQICSDLNEKSYNCGLEAISWLREWIDNNPIDCYILKINTKGLDLATCFWGEYDIGAGLVGSGWAIVNHQESDKYASLENNARKNSYGLWQGSFYTPEDWRNIKRAQNDFTITRKTKSKFFSNMNSWFKW